MAEDDQFKLMNRIVEAITIYYNYFIPAHEDGKTAAEFMGFDPPGWLSALVAAGREKELPFRETKMIVEDPSHFNGVLVSTIAQEIIGQGPDATTVKKKSGRAKVVMQIMEELDKERGRREELNDAERDAYGRHYKSDTRRDSDVEEETELLEAKVSGAGETEWEGEEESPTIRIPFVTLYRIEKNKKNRVRVLLQTYKNGSIAVHFFGDECTVEMDQKEEQRQGETTTVITTFAAYCHPAKNSNAPQVGTRLGAINLYRDCIELSSIVEERHRALRDFVAKLVGEKNLHLLIEMEDAVVDTETGEAKTERMIMEEEADEMVRDRKGDELLADGIEASMAAGIVTTYSAGKEKEGRPEISRSFMEKVLESYEKNPGSGSKSEAMMDAITNTVVSYLMDSEEEEEGTGNLYYETGAAVMAIIFLIQARAEKEGVKHVLTTLNRLINQELVSDEYLAVLVNYFQKISR